MKVISGKRLFQKLIKTDDFLVLMPDKKYGLQIISPGPLDKAAVILMLESAVAAIKE